MDHTDTDQQLSVIPRAPSLPPRALSLREIAERCGVDKLQHKYEAHYEAHLGPLRNERVRLLEIGVKKGASLAMWEEYFPHAQIFGLDIEPSCLNCGTARSRVFIGDQADRVTLSAIIEQIGSPLDVVIDDGGHTMVQQRTSFEVLFAHVRTGGFYIVEDIHTSYREKNGGGERGRPDTFIALLKGLVDDLHHRTLTKRGDRVEFPVAEVHAYPKICFIRKGKPLAGRQS
jgi:demethylmacrocin O-methyltransferase